MLRLFLLLIPSFALYSQQSELSGLIRDVSGGVIAQADLEVVSSATNLRTQSTSSNAGLYRFPPLTPGHYKLIVTAPGFDTHTVNDLKLDVGAKLSLDVTLKIGNVSQSVTVDGSGVQINTINANVSTLIDRQFVKNIPLNGRSFVLSAANSGIPGSSSPSIGIPNRNGATIRLPRYGTCRANNMSQTLCSSAVRCPQSCGTT